MKIVLTGGGSGGHFYPLIAVAEAIEEVAKARHLLEPQLYYIGNEAFDKAALMEHDITFLPSAAGRIRRSGGIGNILSVFPICWGVIRSTMQLFGLYPDVIFSTGGFVAFPPLFAARLLRIPVIIYDADASPGRVSLWASTFAKYIAVAHPEAAEQFPLKVRNKIARVGHPIRREIEMPTKEGGYEFLGLDPKLPTLFIMGGSLGARAINETIMDALGDLNKKYNIIHQAGSANIDEVNNISSVILKKVAHPENYRAFGLLNTLALRMSAGIATIIIARAGSGTIFEVASWGIPAILVPIPLDVSHDQTENAFSYARSGAAVVIEQRNFTSHVLIAEVERIINDPELLNHMSSAAHAFARPQAADKIATILLETATAHESA